MTHRTMSERSTSELRPTPLPVLVYIIVDQQVNFITNSNTCVQAIDSRWWD